MLKKIITTKANVVYGIILLIVGMATLLVESEPGHVDATPFVIMAVFGFISIFYLKPEHFNLNRW